MDRLTILIVEDEQINIELMHQMLNDKFEIKIATDGKKGFDIYKKIQPDIIIADINMPNLNGIEMVKKIRLIDKNVKVIFLTSHQDVSYLLDAVELKLTRYLIKPLDKKDLVQAIDLAVEEKLSYYTNHNNLLKISEDLIWNIQNKELVKNAKLVKLSAKEKDVLAYLLRDLNTIKTYDDILENAWDGFYEEPSKNGLKTVITKLRKKLPQNLIENIYKVGYRIKI